MATEEAGPQIVILRALRRRLPTGTLCALYESCRGWWQTANVQRTVRDFFRDSLHRFRDFGADSFLFYVRRAGTASAENAIGLA